MPAPLSLRIKERYMAKRADGLSLRAAQLSVSPPPAIAGGERGATRLRN
jgi:hypothetical protein